MKKLLAISLILTAHTLFPAAQTSEAHAREQRIENRNQAVARMSSEPTNLELWSLLTDDGMDPNMQVNPGASYRNHPNALEQILGGAPTKYNLIQLAAYEGIAPAITLLADAGADSNCVCPTYGDTLLKIRGYGALTRDQFASAIIKGQSQRETRIAKMEAIDQALLDIAIPKVLIALIKAYTPFLFPVKPGATIEEIA